MQEADKALAQALNRTLAKTTQAGSTAGQKPTNQDAMFINRLFVELQGIFPAWRQALGSKEALDATKRQYTKGLLEAGLTSQNQIELGLKRARQQSSPFIPGVGQFVRWCQEELRASTGLPDGEEAFNDLHRVLASQERDFSILHPAVFYTFRRLDWFNLSQKNTKEQLKVWLKEWDVAIKAVMAGFEFPAVPKLLSSEPKTARFLSKSENQERMAKMREALEV